MNKETIKEARKLFLERIRWEDRKILEQERLKSFKRIKPKKRIILYRKRIYGADVRIIILPNESIECYVGILEL